MQHLLRCWDRQSDGSEYKKTLRRPGLRTPLGELTALPQTPSWWRGAGCSLPKNPIPRSRPFGPRLSYPHSKISSDAVCSMPVLCLYEWTYRQTVFGQSGRDIILVFLSIPNAVTEFQGNPISWDAKYTGEILQTSSFISKTIRDRPIVTMKH